MCSASSISCFHLKSGRSPLPYFESAECASHLNLSHMTSARQSPPPSPITMQTSQSSPLLTLPPELLALLPQYLPYQSTLRLLATCQYIQPLLSSPELASLRRLDSDEIHRMEIATFQSLKAREDWGRRSRWDEPRFGVEEVVFYTCLRWFVSCILHAPFHVQAARPRLLFKSLPRIVDLPFKNPSNPSIPY